MKKNSIKGNILEWKCVCVCVHVLFGGGGEKAELQSQTQGENEPGGACSTLLPGMGWKCWRNYQ